MGPSPARPPDAVYLMAVVVGALVLAAVWAFFGDASFTYDEATYADLAAHPLRSTYYGVDPFLRHPPLAFWALAAWSSVAGDGEMALRGLGLAWSVVGLAFLGLAARVRGTTPALVLVPTVSLPAVIGLVGVSMYPPMFAFLSMAAWAHTTGRRRTTFVAWNLAMFTHELVVFMVAFALAPRAWQALRTARPMWRVPVAWLRMSAAYPVAWLWGLIIIGRSMTAGDPRAGDVATGLWTPEARFLLAMEPVYTVILLVTVTPLLWWVTRRALRSPVEGLGPGVAAFGFLIVGLSPIYRYLVAPLPLLIAYASADTPRWASGARGVAVVLVSGMVATGAAVALIDAGSDPVNLADVPGWMDHRAAVALVEDGGVVGLRSPPALAHYLRADGWTVVDVAPDGPSSMNLTRGGVSLRLVRIELHVTEVEGRGLDAALLPAVWSTRIADLEAAGWSRSGTVHGLVRLDAP